MAPIREPATLGDLDRAVTGGATSMLGWRVADLDLNTRGAQLTGLDAHGAVFLGCEFDPATELALRADGALIFPELPDLPFAAYLRVALRACRALRHRAGRRPLRETTAAPSANSRIRSHAMIQAKISPIVVSA